MTPRGWLILVIPPARGLFVVPGVVSAAGGIVQHMSITDLITFEAAHPGHSNVKARRIEEQFGVSSVRYYQRLNRAIETREALAADPVTVKRLLRLRDARRTASRAA